MQWTPHHGIPTRSFNLVRGFVLMVMLVTAKHLMTDPLELQPLHFGCLTQGRLAPCTCPPLSRPPPEPPNSVLTGHIHARTSSRPLQLAPWLSQLMTRLRQLYSAWHDIFNNTILPLFITVPQPKGMPLDQKDK